MRAAILTIGDEILIGQIVDSNSAFISQNLSLLGIEITEIRTISDDHKQIISSLNSFNKKNDLVVITGGLGPTRDDITKHALAEYFNGTLIENTEVLNHIKKLFRMRGMHISESNRLQATIPDNCVVLENREGTAPGMWFEKNRTIYVSLPGVPYEMKSIVLNELIPRLSNLLNGKIIVNKTISTTGVPESYLAEKIKKWENALPSNFKLAYLPRPGIVRLRLTASGKDKNELEKDIDEQFELLSSIIEDDIYAKKDIGLEIVVYELLKHHNYSLSTAESCTGGGISSLITSVPGSSEIFKGGIIAYSNEIKTNELNVNPKYIQKYGAVSEKVAIAMSQGVKNRFNTNFSIAVTGIAGPTGGSQEKPVGTTWIAVSTPQKTVAHHFRFGEHRGRNIERAKIAALNMLRKSILNTKI